MPSASFHLQSTAVTVRRHHPCIQTRCADDTFIKCLLVEQKGLRALQLLHTIEEAGIRSPSAETFLQAVSTQ